MLCAVDFLSSDLFVTLASSSIDSFVNFVNCTNLRFQTVIFGMMEELAPSWLDDVSGLKT